MSVLIEMLHDLDRRGKSPPMQSSLGAALETAAGPLSAPAKRNGALRALLALGAGVLAVAIGWALWSGGPASHRAAPGAVPPEELAQRVPLPAPLPAPAPAPAQAPAPAPATAEGRPAAAPSAPRAAQGSALGVAPKPGAVPTPAAVSPEPIASAALAMRAPASEAAPAKPPAQAPNEADAAAEQAPVRASSNSANAMVDLARAYDLAQRGRSTEAIEILQRSVRAWPQQNDNRSALASLLSERGLRTEALAVLQDGAAIDPGRFALTAARLQTELGNPAAALQTLALVPQGQRNADYHATAAAIAQRAGRHEVAVEEFRSALAGGQKPAIWWVGLGVSLEQLGQKAEALQAYRQAQSQGDASSATTDFTGQRIAVLATPTPANESASQERPAIATRP